MYYQSFIEKIRELGTGAFGEVHLCRDLAHGEVAVKFFYSSNFNSTAEWQHACTEALAEAQNMKALEHRNVVPVYQVLQGQTAEEFLIVMQYCDRGSLSLMPKTNVIRLTVAKKMVLEAGIGLCYMHNKGYIHRDIKPDNIFRNADGEIKIGDFGFVTDQLMLGFAGGAGTPQYVAPEVLKTLQCSTLTDVYSLGVTLLHMTHGDHWFYRSGKDAVLTEIDFQGDLWLTLNDTYRFLPHVPTEWRNVIKKMAHPEPNKRHQSMEAAVNAMSRLPLVVDWDCKVEPDNVTWRFEKGTRVWNVEWTDYCTTKEAWIAWSEDLAGGARRTMGRSVPTDKPQKRYRALQQWFVDRKL